MLNLCIVFLTIGWVITFWTLVFDIFDANYSIISGREFCAFSMLLKWRKTKMKNVTALMKLRTVEKNQNCFERKETIHFSVF